MPWESDFLLNKPPKESDAKEVGLKILAGLSKRGDSNRPRIQGNTNMLGQNSLLCIMR